MKFQLLAALPLAALIACTPKAEAPAEVPAAAEEAAASLPTCAEAEAASGGQLAMLTPCRLDLGEGRSAVISSADMSEGDGLLRAEITGADGASLQVIEEDATGVYNYPYLEDLTGDGLADLMLPQFTGMVNTSYALWVQGEDGLFSRAGELGGFDITLGSDGLIAASGRSSAAEWETGYYSFENGALKEIAVVVTRADFEDGEPASDPPACEVIRSADGVDIAPYCQPEAEAPAE
ncbi:MAG: hypothetical protein CVT79_17545 [Alphaproteobacteria bacterium HGW-Alphaproteobacteria-18]|nr:MAG: hypothetical protein CVT79_17545 [Alphaproteobacteria bacterium HGW-Alphaproteobacteria-18]